MQSFAEHTILTRQGREEGAFEVRRGREMEGDGGRWRERERERERERD